MNLKRLFHVLTLMLFISLSIGFSALSAELEDSYNHQFKISTDGSLVAGIYRVLASSSQFVVFNLKSHTSYLIGPSPSLVPVAFSPNSFRFLFFENKQPAKIADDQSRPSNWTASIWDKQSQSVTSIPVNSPWQNYFLNNSEIAYLEGAEDFNPASFTKAIIEVQRSQFIPSKFHQCILIKKIQNPSSVKKVRLTLDMPKGLFAKKALGIICASSNGKYFAVRIVSFNAAKPLELENTSFVLLDSRGQPISSIRNMKGNVFPLYVSDDGKTIITATQISESSEWRTAKETIRQIKAVGENIICWDWHTGKILWSRADLNRSHTGGVRFANDFSVCDGLIAVLVKGRPSGEAKHPCLEIVNGHTGLTERTFELKFDDFESIQLTPSRTIVLVRRGGNCQGQICHIDSGEFEDFDCNFKQVD